MKGKIIANQGQLNIFGIKEYEPGDIVKISEIGEKRFVEIQAGKNKPTRILRHLVKTRSINKPVLEY